MLRMRLNSLGRELVNSLIKDNIPLNPDQIVTIHELSKKSTAGLVDSRLLIMASKKVGNVNIYPLTIGAKIWMRTALIEFFPDDEVMAGLVVLYAHSFSREPEKFNFDNPYKCKEDILEWAKTNNITDKEFESVIQSFVNYVPRDEIFEVLLNIIEQIKISPSNINLEKFYTLYKELQFNEDNREDMIPAIAILLKYYGETKEHWLWKESEDVCVALIKQAIEMETGKKNEQMDPSIMAYKELMKYIRELKEENKKCQKN